MPAESSAVDATGPTLGDRFLIRTMPSMIKGSRLGPEQCWTGVDVSRCVPLLQHPLQYLGVTGRVSHKYDHATGLDEPRRARLPFRNRSGGTLRMSADTSGSPQERALRHVAALSSGGPLDPQMRVTLNFHPGYDGAPSP